ncbi:MAG: glucose-1-phosphate thymidylyltransferase [Bacteroidetes bacterium]|nr:MAG: glucose-1-phosphate thymidylyltransferase [Bacteroidota bacterium]PIE87858.1 MAG: glucose-1-phosphate thymidylyltransferase [Bacteroidota bacterium]
MNLIFFDDNGVERLLPLTFYRPTAALRTGILTNAERWERILQVDGSYHTRPYLSKAFPLTVTEDNLLLNGRLLPDEELVEAVRNLQKGEYLVCEEVIVAARLGAGSLNSWDMLQPPEGSRKKTCAAVKMIRYGWDLFALCDEFIRYDFELITQGRESAPLSNTNTVIGDGPVFLEEGAVAECAVFNTNGGPVYLGAHSEVMEGAVVRGPFALGEHSVLKMMAKIYGATSIGPHCKVGGEVSNSVFLGYANKAHDGFLGQAVISHWCNLGADTNNSNLKNTYGKVRMWSYPEQQFISTELQFCGLLMGDHSKCGINTMFNTGTVVGVNCNIFGAGYQKNRIPSFSKGSGAKMSGYSLEKNKEVAAIVYQRRGLPFDEVEREIMASVYQLCSANKHY